LINLRWIHYWYDNAAGDTFWKTVLKMMMDLFYDKIAEDSAEDDDGSVL
jgi:hypothetical protein